MRVPGRTRKFAGGSPTKGSSSKFAKGQPKSSFAWIDSDGNGHLPYKNPDGSINAAHVRNALARANQVKGLGGADLQRVLAKLRAALRSVGGHPGGDSRNNSEAFMVSDMAYYVGSARKFYETDEENTVMIEVFPLGSWEHPEYGTVEITPEVIEEMKQGFDEGITETETPWTYEHGTDPAKGGKRSGTVKSLEITDTGLWAAVEMTPTALKELQEGEWMYASGEYKPSWTSQHTNKTYNNVFWGGTLTNYPFLRGIAPINCSEMFMFDDFEVRGVGEERELEQSEPGTGYPPAIVPIHNDPRSIPPSTPPDPDPGVTPPGATGTDPTEGGENHVDEAQLRELLGIDAEADIEATIGEMRERAEAVTVAASEQDKARSFAEQYPDQARQLAELRERDRRNEAHKFAEQYSTTTVNGRTRTLVPSAREQLEDAYLKLSEGSLTQEDLQAFVESIMQHGTVEIGERGASTAPDGESAGDPILAARKLHEIATTKVKDSNGELGYQAALRMAASENPQLFEESSQRVKLHDQREARQVVEVVR